ncbi:MAG TPA: hypothetical protein VF989_08685 [Polyangiaceae bacterium]
MLASAPITALICASKSRCCILSLSAFIRSVTLSWASVICLNVSTSCVPAVCVDAPAAKLGIAPAPMPALAEAPLTASASR